MTKYLSHFKPFNSFKIFISSFLILLSIVMGGCSTKEYIYLSPKEYSFKIYDRLEPLNVSLDRNSFNLSASSFKECKPMLVETINQIKPYINTQREIILNYESQISDYNESITRLKNKNEKKD